MSRYDFCVFEDGKLKEVKDTDDRIPKLGDLVRCTDGGIYGIIDKETKTGEFVAFKLNAMTLKMDFDSTYYFFPEEIVEKVDIESLKKQKKNLSDALKRNKKVNDKTNLATVDKKPEKNEQAKKETVQYNDSHYAKLAVQPMDVISKWPIQQQIGFYRGNILKYAMRLGNKDAGISEASKILRYAQWLYEAMNGNTVDPRK